MKYIDYPTEELHTIVEEVWEAREASRQWVKETRSYWAHASRHCRLFVRRGAVVTGRPTPEAKLGKVTLHWKNQRRLVQVEVIEPDGTKDHIRYPLSWMPLPRSVWMDLLRKEHIKAND